MELEIYSFGELVANSRVTSATTIHECLEQVVELTILAEAGGFDATLLGEHHRIDFSTSAPEIVLAAIA